MSKAKQQKRQISYKSEIESAVQAHGSLRLAGQLASGCLPATVN